MGFKKAILENCVCCRHILGLMFVSVKPVQRASITSNHCGKSFAFMQLGAWFSLHKKHAKVWVQGLNFKS